jgi:hypothetical protein
MANEPTGGGNPNVFKTFKGRYELTPGVGTWDSVAVMLSCVNDVQIMGNCALDGYTAGATIATLPPECRPLTTLAVPVVSNFDLDVMFVEPSGALKLATGFTGPGTIMLCGSSFNISHNWY